MPILSANDRHLLEVEYRAVRDKRSANHINCLLLLDDGYEYAEVAAILRIDDATVRRQEISFKEKGIREFLRNPFSGGKCRLSEEQQRELSNYLEQNLCETTAQVVAHVKDTYGVTYTTSGMNELLGRLDFVYKKPELVPGKADESVQTAFVEYYKQIKKSMRPNDKIYFVDGVHPQYNSMPAYGWIRKGKDVTLKSNTGRERVNISGALDPQTLEVIAKTDKTLDADATISFFKMIEEKNVDAESIVLIVDNARYYYNGDVIEYVANSKKIKLVFLPAYAPNLNLIERLWKFMKKKVLYNRYYPTFKEFQAALGNFFLRLPEYYEELSTLLTEEFQIIGVV